jgi:hypothetical protein
MLTESVTPKLRVEQDTSAAMCLSLALTHTDDMH